MGQPQRRKKNYQGSKPGARYTKAKRLTRGFDQIDADLDSRAAQRLLNQAFDEDKPGGGQNYCLHCATHFVDPAALNSHLVSKRHKQRVKQFKEEPYTQQEAERAAGMGSYIKPKRRQVFDQHTAPLDSEGKPILKVELKVDTEQTV